MTTQEQKKLEWTDLIKKIIECSDKSNTPGINLEFIQAEMETTHGVSSIITKRILQNLWLLDKVYRDVDGNYSFKKENLIVLDSYEAR